MQLLVDAHALTWWLGGSKELSAPGRRAIEADVEAQTKFELRGSTATLAGRPDVIARPENKAAMFDAKAG